MDLAWPYSKKILLVGWTILQVHNTTVVYKLYPEGNNKA